MSNFRLKLKLGATAPAPTAAFLAERPNKEKPLHSKDENNFKTTGKVQKCHAFLQAFQQGKTKTNSFGAFQNNYVVIGRGFSATTNLATLRSPFGKNRVSNMNLIVIGHDDPWSIYVRHNMNQEVELLTLPGYANRPALAAPNAAPRWLDSRQFAAKNTDELQRAASAKQPDWPQLTTLRASVTWIEKVIKQGKEIFYVHFNDRKTIQAKCVDICTGTGQQTYAEAGGERGINMSQQLWDEYLDPKRAVVAGKPRIISAEMYVAGDRQVIPNASVLITSANSPAGIQAGEHALCQDAAGNADVPASEVVLIAAESMSGGFPPIGRLDSHARTATSALPVRLHHPITEPLFPTNAHVWFGEKYRVKSIEVLNQAHCAAFTHENGTAISGAGVDKKLLVTFAALNGTRFVRGQALPHAPLPPEENLLYGLFDQVVISTGRARGGRGEKRTGAEKEEGSALQLVWGMKDELGPIEVPGYDFPVGLQTNNGRLRILGAAGLNNPIYKSDARAKNFKKYEDSLPWQARVFGEGVTLAAQTIALANHYFKTNKTDLNSCVNTATRDELILAAGAKAGREIFDARHWRVRPFQAHQEIVRVLEYRKNYMSSIGEPARVKTASSNANDLVIPNGLAHEALMLAIDTMNNTGLLLDDDAWIKVWSDEWQRTEVKETELTGVQMRYAHSIQDPQTRKKLEADTP